jgi:hypothetical protein
MNKRWTEAEDATLARHYRSMTHEQITELLPGRTRNSVRNRCHVLGLLTHRPWTDEERGVVRSWYEERTSSPLELYKLAELLGRPKPSVCMLANKLGLANGKRRGGQTRAIRKQMGASLSARWEKQGHPRGMLGKKQPPEATARSVAGRKKKRALLSAEQATEIALRAVQTKIERYGTAAPQGFMDGSSNPYSRTKSGRRTDLGGIFFRSRWEANYARFLNLLKTQGQIQRWEYEAETFWFEAIKRGVRSYTPDFKIWGRDGSVYFIEVKGWMDAKSKTKLKRMKKYHPEVDLRLFGAKAYRELERKLGAAIPGWE